MSEQVTIRERDVDVSRRKELIIDGKAVSYVSTRHYDLRIGCCVGRMRGVDSVATDKAYRMRGYARHLMTETIDDIEEPIMICHWSGAFRIFTRRDCGKSHSIV